MGPWGAPPPWQNLELVDIYVLRCFAYVLLNQSCSQVTKIELIKACRSHPEIARLLQLPEHMQDSARDQFEQVSLGEGFSKRMAEVSSNGPRQPLGRDSFYKMPCEAIGN